LLLCRRSMGQGRSNINIKSGGVGVRGSHLSGEVQAHSESRTTATDRSVRSTRFYSVVLRRTYVRGYYLVSLRDWSGVGRFVRSNYAAVNGGSSGAEALGRGTVYRSAEALRHPKAKEGGRGGSAARSKASGRGRPLPHEFSWRQGTADSSPYSPLIAAVKGSE